ncbi:MAG: hypothetical protein FIO04_02605 [Nitrosopumilales archaeon]|nr:hypothetical protein [Nitrosopumilales archaeon]
MISEHTIVEMEILHTPLSGGKGLSSLLKNRMEIRDGDKKSSVPGQQHTQFRMVRR